MHRSTIVQNTLNSINTQKRKPSASMCRHLCGCVLSLDRILRLVLKKKSRPTYCIKCSIKNSIFGPFNFVSLFLLIVYRILFHVSVRNLVMTQFFVLPNVFYCCSKKSSIYNINKKYLSTWNINSVCIVLFWSLKYCRLIKKNCLLFYSWKFLYTDCKFVDTKYHKHQGQNDQLNFIIENFFFFGMGVSKTGMKKRRSGVLPGRNRRVVRVQYIH